MNVVIELDIMKEKKFNRMIDIHSCSAIINDSLEKLENHRDQPEVLELIYYLQTFVRKLNL